MLAPPGLDAGFLVCRDHELVILQRLVFPVAGVSVENAAGFIRKVGIAGGRSSCGDTRGESRPDATTAKVCCR
jgi:hypothetical protein